MANMLGFILSVIWAVLEGTPRALQFSAHNQIWTSFEVLEQVCNAAGPFSFASNLFEILNSDTPPNIE